MDTKSLLLTKFNRPPLPRYMVRRPRIAAHLTKRMQFTPLTLVSGPAGYGKSTLVSEWLESAACPTAWLSVDEEDNDLYIFLRYLVRAIQLAHPKSLTETESLLASGRVVSPCTV